MELVDGGLAAEVGVGSADGDLQAAATFKNIKDFGVGGKVYRTPKRPL
jgi:hypothetical protein